MMNWLDYAPYFTEDEFRCKHTGRCWMEKSTMDKLLALRLEYAAPMNVSSGCRDKTHPIEAKKTSPGAHTTGRAVDISVAGGDALRLLALGLKHGFTGIGVQQKGAGRFIHFDDVEGTPAMPRPWIWSY